jgi:hypothetical protein
MGSALYGCGLPTADADSDGIPDAWERRTFGDPSTPDSGADRDGDGLTDLEEFAFGSDPRTFSTMGDGWSDKEKRDAGLGAVYCVSPAAGLAQWGTPHGITSYLHHDAKYEMRSVPVSGGYGHQATYNTNGIIMNSPLRRGSIWH